MNEKLRIVLVGCGGISNSWLQALKGIADVSVVGLVDLDRAIAGKKKQEHDLVDAQIGTDVDAMLRAMQPNIVFDCTVPGARAAVVRAALQHGSHVLSEKPMAATMAEAQQLLTEAEKAQRFFAIMQNRRYDPRIRALRSFLDSGTVGELTILNGDFYVGAHFGGFRDKMPHVLLLDMAIHSFDQARLISGADPLAVYCREWNPRGSWYDRDASAVAIFEMSNGIIYSYRGSWCAEGLNTSWECAWRTIATQGTVSWDGADELRAQRAGEGEGLTRIGEDIAVAIDKTSTEAGHAGCIREFIECVRTGRTPETICTANIYSLAMVFAAIKSSESGKRIPIQI